MAHILQATKDPVRTNNQHAWAAPQAVCPADNQVPRFASNPPLRANATVPWLYVVATDDTDNDALTLSLAHGPAGMNLVADRLQWLPTLADAGSEYSVSLLVTDGRGGSQQQDFLLVVGQPPLMPGQPVSNIELVLHADRASYASNEVVTLAAELANLADPGRNGTLRIEILDPMGGVIATPLSAGSVVFVGGGSQSFSAAFNTGLSVPGAYQAVARYQEGTAETVATTNFRVTSPTDVEVSLSASPYSSHQQVPITTRYRSQAMAGIIRLQPTLTVYDPAGLAIFSQALGQVDVAAGEQASRLTIFDTGTRQPGTYVARVVVVHDGIEVARAEGTFVIRASVEQPGETLEGALVVNPASVPWGSGSTTLTGTLTNKGNVDLVALEVRLRIVDPRTLAVIRDDGHTLSLAMGASQTMASTFALDGLVAGDYVATLEALAGTATLLSTSAALAIIDATPPLVSITVPACSAGDVTPVITIVEESLMSQQAVLDTAAYTPGTPISAEGSHTLTVTAVDAGGLSGTASATFAIDRTAPTVTFEQVVQGAVARSFSPVVHVTDANLVSHAATLDGAPFVAGTVVDSEGHHQLAVTATDCAGNVANEVVEFDVDLTPPVVAISVPPCTAQDVVPVIQTVDLHPATQVVLLDGIPYGGGPVVVEGPHLLVVAATDAAGNAGGQQMSFIIDRTAPTIAVTGLAGGGAYRTPVSPVIAVSDANLVISAVTLDGQPYLSGTAIASEGAHALAANAADCAGNTAASALPFLLDFVAPVVSISGAPSCGQGPATPSVSATDAAEPAVPPARTCLLDGQALPSCDGISIDSQGEHLLQVTATDRAGNQSAPAAATFIVDRTAPQVTVQGVVEGGAYNHSVTPVIQASDQHLTGQTVTLNGAPYASGTPVAADGTYVLAASAQDCAGNQGSAQVHFAVDTQAPVIVIDVPACAAGLVTPIITVTEPRVASDVRLLDGQPYDNGGVTAEGRHTLTVTVTDTAGNTATQSVDFTVDNTAPTIELAGLVSGRAYNQPVTPLVVFQDAVEITLTLNGQPFTSGTTVGNDGDYALAATARDCAGNHAELDATFRIDQIAPTVSIDAPSCQAAPVAPTVSVADAHLQSDERTLDGQPWDGSPITAEGSHTLRVIATDDAGNRTEREAVVMVDNTPPAIAVAGVAEGGWYRTTVTPLVSISEPNLTTSAMTLDGQDYGNETPVGSEGAHVLAVTATDCAGHTASRTTNFNLDFAAPVLTVVDLPACAGAALTPLVTADEPVTLSATLDALPYELGVPIAAEGTHQLSVLGTDRAGNTTTSVTTFVIDLTPPQLGFANVADGGAYRIPVSPLVEAADANLASLQSILDGQPFSNGTVVSADGHHVLSATAADCAGHVISATATFLVDQLSPAVTISVPACAVGPITPQITVVEANVASQTATLDGASYSGGPVNTEGGHDLSVTVLDQAGNQGSASAHFVVDRTQPALVIGGVQEGGVYQVPVAPTVSVTDANLVSSVVTVNGVPFASGTTLAVDGSYTLVATASDCAGNQSSQTVHFQIQIISGTLSHALDYGSRILLANEGGGGPQLLRATLAQAALPWEEATNRTEWLGKLRSGRFNHVVLFKPAILDGGSALPELDEAVWLGDGLLVIKNTADPLTPLRQSLGLDFSATILHPTTLTLQSPLQPATVPMSGAAVRLQLGTASTIARPQGDSSSVGALAGIGLGDAVTLSWDTETSAAQQLYQSAVSASAPASGVPLLAGGTIRLRTTVHNTGLSQTTYTLTHTLAPELCTQDDLQHTLVVAGGATHEQRMTVHLPVVAGNYTVTSRLVADGRLMDEGTFTFAVTLTTEALRAQAVSGLQALGLTGTNAQKRDEAVTLVGQAAQASLALDAVGLVWRAIDAVRGITGVDVVANHVDLARLLRSYQMAASGSGKSANLDGLPCFGYAIAAAATCSRMPPSPIDNAGCITVNSNTHVDGYSHSLGAYGGSNVRAADVAMRCNDRAHDSNNTCVENCGSACITGSVRYLVNPGYAAIAEPPSTPNSTQVNVNSGLSVTLDPAGSVAFYDTLAVNPGGTLTLKTGRYVVRNLLLNSGGTFKVDGTVRVWARNAPSPNTPVSITSGNPRDFWLIYNGTGTINNNSGNKFYGVLYAPAAKLNLNYEVFGAVVAGGLSLNGGAKVHYDTELSCASGGGGNPDGGLPPDGGPPGQCSSDPGATF